MRPIQLLLVLACALVMHSYIKSRRRRPLPPGPRRWPIIGNALDLPNQKEWLTYTKWSEIYGPIVSLTVFGRNIIILNTPHVARELLQKRSSIYSDRPRFPFIGEMVGWENSLGLTHYGDYFRQMRRLAHQLFSPQPARTFWRAEEQETVKFLHHLLQTPEKFAEHIRHLAGSIVLKISHGYTVIENGTDPLVAIAEKASDEFSAVATAGAHLVDHLPWLKSLPRWFPYATFHQTAAEWRKDTFKMADTAHNFTKEQMASFIHPSLPTKNDAELQALGTAVPSFTSKLLEGDYTPETEFLVKWTAFSIYAGGADTTVAAITTFFLAMCLYPEVQETAKAELDSVVGNQRLPTVEDRASLPYIEAIVKEVSRWAPTLPAALPHRLTQEDEYEGYRIPEGSIVIPNIWGMTHDPEVFPEPDEFRPGRFIGPKKAEVDPLQLVFGFGRRTCPGQHLAEPSLFLAFAMTLATFTISKARDEKSGEIIHPRPEWEHGILSHPIPFPCEIKPRSDRAIDLIKQTVAAYKD